MRKKRVRKVTYLENEFKCWDVNASFLAHVLSTGLAASYFQKVRLTERCPRNNLDS